MAGFVRPQAVEVMREIGLHISGHSSKSVDELLGEWFDHVITVYDDASERCPIFPARPNASTRASTTRRRPRATMRRGSPSSGACATSYAGGCASSFLSPFPEQPQI
jgi:protein-tyrosine-phosphatase